MKFGTNKLKFGFELLQDLFLRNHTHAAKKSIKETSADSAMKWNIDIRE